jgi:hypothetical protein
MSLLSLERLRGFKCPFFGHAFVNRRIDGDWKDWVEGLVRAGGRWTSSVGLVEVIVIQWNP